MIIDWHTHLYPPEETEKPYWNGRCQMTLDNVLRAQDEAGIDATVVSNPGNYWAKLPAEDALAVVERQNRYYAEMQERHPGRIPMQARTISASSNAPSRKTASRACASIRASRATIPTTRRRCPSSSWPPGSTSP
jgi:hypothetical protein